MALDWVPGSPPDSLDKLLKRFRSQEWTLLSSAHHLIEILQHDNQAVREKRLQMLQTLPQIGWIRSTVPDSDQHLGIMADIHYQEACLLLDDRARSFAEIKECLWDDIAVWLSPAQSFSKEVLDNLRAMAPEHLARSRDAATQVKGLDSLTSSIADSNLDTPFPTSSVEECVDAAVLSYQAALVACKDKALHDTAIQEKELADLLSGCVRKAREIGSGATMRQVLCAAFGIPAAWERNCVTIDQLSDTISFQGKLSSIFAHRKAGKKWEASTLQANTIPSYVVVTGLRNAQLSGQQRTSGSDLTDAFSAPLSLYSDILVVDNRTREFFRQRWVDKSGLRGVIGDVLSIVHYEELLAI